MMISSTQATWRVLEGSYRGVVTHSYLRGRGRGAAGQRRLGSGEGVPAGCAPRLARIGARTARHPRPPPSPSPALTS